MAVALNFEALRWTDGRQSGIIPTGQTLDLHSPLSLCEALL